MLIRRETPEDVEAVRQVHTAAFASAEKPNEPPAEAWLVDALRADPEAAIPTLSLVAIDPVGEDDADPADAVVGHVVCTRARIEGAPALGLGPLGVRPERQRSGVGSALLHSVLAGADALQEQVVVLLGHTDYYPRFGFRPAREYGIEPPYSDWGDHFQARPLYAYDPSVRGRFAYAAPFDRL